MITKQQLDEHITKDYDRLYSIIEGMIYKKFSKLNPSLIIAEAYQNMLDKLDKIEPDKISHFITSFARMSISFTNNPINKENYFSYVKRDFIRSFSDKLTDDFEEDYFNDVLIDEVYDIEDEGYTIKDVEKVIDEWRQTLPLMDSIMAENLLDYLLNVDLDYGQIYNVSTRLDIEFYKRKMRELKKTFLEYCTNKRILYK